MHMLICLLITFSMFVAYTCREGQEKQREQPPTVQEEVWEFNAAKDTAKRHFKDSVHKISEHDAHVEYGRDQ